MKSIYTFTALFSIFLHSFTPCASEGMFGMKPNGECHHDCRRFWTETNYICGMISNHKTRLFKNECFLMARACREQIAIPFYRIKSNASLTEARKTCKRGPFKHHERPCKSLLDYQGMCGTGDNGFSGACMHNYQDQSTYCSCPDNTFGENCEIKVFQRS